MEQYGLAYSWYAQYKNEKLVTPEDYSGDHARSLLDSYSAPVTGDTAPEAYPDIVVIMNESFADYTLCGKTTFEDPLKHLHDPANHYTENAIAVSVYGGNTANTEFEFLTGESLLFMPKQCFPFLQYMTRDMQSITRDLNSIGFRSDAIHPFYADGWNRANAYKHLGFERFFSGDDLLKDQETDAAYLSHEDHFPFGSKVEYLRGYISDRQCYQFVTDALEPQDRSEPRFVFAVTMQNHGDYAYSGQDFSAREFTGDMAVDQYLTCLTESDQAFFELTGRLKKSSRKTLVLMFGDHQPAINISPFITWNDKLDEAVRQYIVPYVFWANYEMEFDPPGITSPNYLSAVLKQYAKLPLNSWDHFRIDRMKEYPVMTQYSFLKDGLWHKGDEIKNEPGLHEYELIQDYLLLEHQPGD